MKSLILKFLIFNSLIFSLHAAELSGPRTFACDNRSYYYDGDVESSALTDDPATCVASVVSCGVSKERKFIVSASGLDYVSARNRACEMALGVCEQNTNHGLYGQCEIENI